MSADETELPADPVPPYLLERFQTWHARRYEPNRLWFGRLAEGGQNPRTMVVSCCDSRVDTVQMFGAEPGDLFVVRNVANLIPPYEPDHQHHGTSAAVEYAVRVLDVAHILVVGHSNCGGVAACEAMCSGSGPAMRDGALGFVTNWMEILRPGWERVRQANPDPAARRTALEREAVLTSLRNLAGFPFVRSGVAERRLSLHGAWIDISDGVLHVYSPASGQFEPASLGTD